MVLPDDGGTTTFNITGAGNLTIDSFDDGSSETTSSSALMAGAGAKGAREPQRWRQQRPKQRPTAWKARPQHPMKINNKKWL